MASLGRREYQDALNAVVSPALGRAAELLALSDELRTRASSAESIVREVETLFAQLQKEIATKQAEQSALMRQSGRELRVLELTQDQIDDLMGVWEQRHVREKTRDKWRDLAFVILGSFIGLGLTILWEMAGPLPPASQ